MPRRLLVITYPYPPIPSVGGNRWVALSKYLRRLGHDVTVITTSLMGPLEDDADQQVVRTRDLAGETWIRKALRRPPLRIEGGGVPTDTAPPELLTRVAVPDAYLASWVPFAVAAARRLVRERRIDCVVTTTPYESTHLVASMLGKQRPAWIADFRDGWLFEPHRAPFPTALQRDLDSRLERLVVGSADRVIGATLPIVEDFRARLGVEAVHVPNGWDPELAPALEPGDAGPLRQDRVTLLHTGTLTGSWGRDPSALLAAIERLLDEDPEVAARLDVMLVGRMTTGQEDLLRRFRLGDVVRTTGLLSREESLALQRRAHALLLVTAEGNRGEATGKLFEYLGSGRPILALAEGNEAARIVRATGTGVAVPPGDSDAIAAALRRLLRGELLEDYSPIGLDRYLYPAPARALAEEVERALSQRVGRGGPGTA